MNLNRIISFIIVLSCLLCCLSSCKTGDVNDFVSYDFIAMDTYVNIKLSPISADQDGKKFNLDKEYLDEVAEECEKTALELDRRYSAYDGESIVSEINTECDRLLDLNDGDISFLTRCLDISDKLEGYFDPTVGAFTLLWNITSEDAEVPDDSEITEALNHVGCDKLEISENSVIKNDRKTKLDLGGVAKGYALEQICDYISSTDVKLALVNFGGAVGTVGSKSDGKPFKIGITDPKDKNSVLGYLYTNGEYVSVSGTYERYAEIDGVRYGHIFDPATGRPCESDITSVAVICHNALNADALSTALYVMGLDRALEFSRNSDLEFEAVFTKTDGTLYFTDGILNGDVSDTAADKDYIEFEEYITDEE